MPGLRALLALGLALGALGACATADPLRKRDFAAAGVREGMSQAAVRKVLGAPANASSPARWSYPGVELAFSDGGAVRAITLRDPRYATDRGLRPGDSSERLLRLHGSPYRLNGQQYHPAAGFPPPVPATWTYCEPRDFVCTHTLTVELDAAGRVAAIRLGDEP